MGMEGGGGWIEGGIREGDAFVDPGTGAFGGLRLETTRRERVSLWGEAAWGGYDRFDGLRAGGIALPLDAFTVSAVREPIRTATPASESVQYGGQVPLDLLYLTTNRSISVPGLDWIFGPGEGQIAFGPFGGLGRVDEGWIGLFSAQSRPHPRFRIGAARAIHAGRSAAVDSLGGAPVTLDRAFRALFLIENDPHDWDDQKAEIFFELRLEPFGRPFSPYVVLSQEDAPPFLDSGVHAGFRTAGVNGAGLWMMRYEYLGIGERGRWCWFCEKVSRETGGGLSESGREQATWYRHGRIAWPYEVRGIPLGESLGGYGSRHRVDLWFWPTGAAYRLRGWAFEERREDANLLMDRWPGLRRGLGLEGAIHPRPRTASGGGGSVELVGSAVTASGPDLEREWGLRLGLRARIGGAEGPGTAPPTGRPADSDPEKLTPDPASIPEMGVEVELHSPALLHRRVRGTLVDVEAGEWLVKPGAAGESAVSLKHGELTRARYVESTGRATLRGLAIGTLTGLVLGVYYDEHTAEELGDPRVGLRLAATGAGALGGAALGWRIPVRRWRDIPLR